MTPSSQTSNFALYFKIDVINMGSITKLSLFCCATKCHWYGDIAKTSVQLPLESVKFMWMSGTSQQANTLEQANNKLTGKTRLYITKQDGHQSTHGCLVRGSTRQLEEKLE